MSKFNLIDEPWIPVLKEGKIRQVSLQEALTHARDIERVEVASPLAEAALYRLLLAVLHRALEGPRDEEEALELLEQGRFPEDKLSAYLRRHHDRFWLFDNVAPFFQVVDLPEEDPLPWTKLVPERASGHNPTLFDHTTDDNPPAASYADAAISLLVHQGFQPGELLRRMEVISAKAAPLAKAAIILPQEENLFETLVLNLVPYDLKGDAPVWEIPPLKATDVRAYKTKWPLSGVTRVYTWPARGVRLLDEGSAVRYMAYGPGVKPQETAHQDPMLAYRQDREGQLRIVGLDLDRAFWRNFDALLPQTGQSPPKVLAHAARLAWQVHRRNTVPIRVLGQVLGQVSDQAKIQDVRREVYPFPKDALGPQVMAWVRTALERAKKVGDELEKVGEEVGRELLDSNRKQLLRKQVLRDFLGSLALMRLYWSRLDKEFPYFLENLAARGGSAIDGWKETVEKAACWAWETTRLSLGTQARHLKAVRKAEARFASVIREARA